jgi:hypothetical protein
MLRRLIFQRLLRLTATVAESCCGHIDDTFASKFSPTNGDFMCVCLVTSAIHALHSQTVSILIAFWAANNNFY